MWWVLAAGDAGSKLGENFHKLAQGFSSGAVIGIVGCLAVVVLAARSASKMAVLVGMAVVALVLVNDGPLLIRTANSIANTLFRNV